jgi:outer membrane protein insertion porin family
MKKNLLAGLMATFFASGVAAMEPFTVKDIRLEGIQRVEAGTVFSYLPVKVGDTMTDDKAAQAIKALFATGFFKDVRIEIDRGVVVVVLAERPAIAQIDFVGLKEFDQDQLIKGLKEVGVAVSRTFDRATLEKAEQELKRQYLSRGRYAATITTTITPLDRNRVAINFSVDEGETAKIKQINIVGVQAFREKDLLAVLQQKTPTWISWYTKSDQYSKQKLSADLETLRSYYLDRGYLEFSIESTQVSITPDKKEIYITISINEGERYLVSSVKLAGDLTLPEEEFRKAVKIKPGEVFSREKLNESTKAIADKLGAQGYAFANVNASPELDKEKRQVAFTIFVDPGKRTYVRRVNVTGNTKTRDEVIRQEMRQMEGAWYDADRVAASRERIDRTNYFAEVNVETPPVPGTIDQVDVNVNVVEKSTGNISIGAGYSSAEKVILSGSISQSNIFGSGKFLSLQVNTGKLNRTLGSTTPIPISPWMVSARALTFTTASSTRPRSAMPLSQRQQVAASVSVFRLTRRSRSILAWRSIRRRSTSRRSPWRHRPSTSGFRRNTVTPTSRCRRPFRGPGIPGTVRFIRPAAECRRRPWRWPFPVPT